jgi:hypothetical protein
MKAASMWTINDLPAYGMVSGYSMYGKITCLYCMENNKAFTLTNNGKMSFFLLPLVVLANGSQVQKEQKGLLYW